MNNNYKLIYLSVFFGVVTMSTACKKDNTQELDKRDFTLVWSDDFNGEEGTLPDSTKWTYDLGNGVDGWGNQELQSYTKKPENVSLDGNGNLVITALQAGNSFTSARIKTQGLFSQRYGRFEAKIITPYGPGIWPAFWMLGDNITSVSWPQCGEIDIMEMRGQEPHIIHGTIHGPQYSGGNAITKSYTLLQNRYDKDYHLFAVEWTEDKIDFFMDDFLYHRIEKADLPGPWVFDQSFFMILNIAVGGTYVGFPTNQTPFPQKMIIDYVKVYRLSN